MSRYPTLFIRIHDIEKYAHIFYEPTTYNRYICSCDVYSVFRKVTLKTRPIHISQKLRETFPKYNIHIEHREKDGHRKIKESSKYGTKKYGIILKSIFGIDGLDVNIWLDGNNQRIMLLDVQRPTQKELQILKDEIYKELERRGISAKDVDCIWDNLSDDLPKDLALDTRTSIGQIHF